MTTITYNADSVTKSLRLLRDGFQDELARSLFEDQRTVELFH